MLPLAAGTLREDSPSLLSKLSEFSLSPPDEEEEQNVQTVDRPAKDSAKTDSAKTYSSDHRRKFHGTNSHSSHNEIYLARILPRGPRVNRDVTRSNFHVSSPSSNHGAGRPTVYFRSPSRRGRTTSTRVFHEIKRNNTIEYQVHDATKQDLLRRLEQGVSEKGLKTELKVMVNMMSQMNILLSKFSDSTIAGTLRLSTKARVVKRVHELAGQMMHYFDRLSKEFERQINDIAEIKAYLPTLGPHVKPTLLRTALKLWDQRIIITYVNPYSSPILVRLPSKIRETNSKKTEEMKTQDEPRFSPALRTRSLHPAHHLFRRSSQHRLPPQAAISLKTPIARPHGPAPRAHPTLHDARVRHSRDPHARDGKSSSGDERGASLAAIRAGRRRLRLDVSPGARLPTHDRQAGAKSERGGGGCDYSAGRAWS